jgi:hypothetical protein
MHYSFGVEESYALHHFEHHIFDEVFIKLLPIIFDMISQTLTIHQVKDQPQAVFEVEGLPTCQNRVFRIGLSSLHHLNLPLNGVHISLFIRLNELEDALSFIVVPAEQKDTTSISCGQSLLNCVEL